METVRQGIIRVVLWQAINLLVNIAIVYLFVRQPSVVGSIVLTNLGVKVVLQYGYGRLFQKFSWKTP